MERRICELERAHSHSATRLAYVDEKVKELVDLLKDKEILDQEYKFMTEGEMTDAIDKFVEDFINS